MDDKQKRSTYFWPIMFLAAFLLGAVLWGLWMSKVVQQTRRNRENNFFVPQSNALPPGLTNPAPAATNPPTSPP